MSGFTADWLALREAADARARSQALVGTLPRQFPAIVDLGAGTGANLRWLAPRLEPPQHWTLVDDDASLLVAARKSTRAWARGLGYQARGRGNHLAITGNGFEGSVTTLKLDLSRDLAALDLPRGCLVTASALFDLVSRDWLASLVARVAASRASILWTLSYDGSVTIDPVTTDSAVDDDNRILALVNRHQTTDKGFGPALGPDAWLVARSQLEQAGLDVRVVDSSWHCGEEDSALIKALIEGWAEAAIAVAPGETKPIRAWRKQRLAQAAKGGLRVSVGHRDLAGRPR